MLQLWKARIVKIVIEGMRFYPRVFIHSNSNTFIDMFYAYPKCLSENFEVSDTKWQRTWAKLYRKRFFLNFERLSSKSIFSLKLRFYRLFITSIQVHSSSSTLQFNCSLDNHRFFGKWFKTLTSLCDSV